MTTLTKGEMTTLTQLREYGTKKVKIAQSGITRLLKKLLKTNDDERLKEVIPEILEFERDQGKDINYLRKKLPGEDKKHFTKLAGPFIGTPNRLGDEPVKPKRDMEKIIESRDEMMDQLNPKQKQKQINIGDIVSGVTGAKKTYDSIPGSGPATKLLYYSVPELELLQKFIDQTPAKWTDRDSKYLENVLDSNYQGPDKDSFRDRLEWIAKVISNPSKWFEITSKMAWSEIKNSPIGEWFYDTFSKVAVKYDSSTAQKLRDSYRTGKPQGPSFTMKKVDDKTTDKTIWAVSDAPPKEKPSTGSRMTGTIPVTSRIIETPIIDLNTGGVQSEEQTNKTYRAMVHGLFSNTDSDAERLFLDDPTFKRDFGDIYKKYHPGKRLRGDVDTDIFKGLTHEQARALSSELDKSATESMRRQKLPPRKFYFKYSEGRGAESGAGVLLDDTGRTLLEKFVNNLKMIDGKLRDFITRGQKLPGDYDPVELSDKLKPYLKKYDDMLKDPNTRFTKQTITDIDELPKELSKLDQVFGTVTNNATALSNGVRAILNTDSATSTRTGTDTDPRLEDKDKKPDDPDDPDKKYQKPKKPITEEEAFSGPKKKIAELRPKLGFMTQQELEDTLIGTAEERMITNHTWSVYDLKPVNESSEIGEQNIEFNPVYDRTVDHYNMRYGRTFKMPYPPPEKPAPTLYRKQLRDIYESSKKMLDAYDNEQFKGINPESYIAPKYEERAVSTYDRLIPIIPYRAGIDSYDYRRPRVLTERIHSLKNKGKHF